jgi:hypothetical protein
MLRFGVYVRSIGMYNYLVRSGNEMRDFFRSMSR